MLAIDPVLTDQRIAVAKQFLVDSANLYNVSQYASDLGQPILPIYMDYGDRGQYFSGGLSGANVEFTHANDMTGVGYGRTSWKFPQVDPLSSATPYVEFNIESAGPRDIPEIGIANTLRFLARSDANGRPGRN